MPWISYRPNKRVVAKREWIIRMIVARYNTQRKRWWTIGMGDCSKPLWRLRVPTISNVGSLITPRPRLFSAWRTSRVKNITINCSLMFYHHLVYLYPDISRRIFHRSAFEHIRARVNRPANSKSLVHDSSQFNFRELISPFLPIILSVIYDWYPAMTSACGGNRASVATDSKWLTVDFSSSWLSSRIFTPFFLLRSCSPSRDDSRDSWKPLVRFIS